MTTQTTTIQPSTKGMRALVGAAAAGLALLGGALLWQARPTSEPATIVTTVASSLTSEGVAPLGGMAELYAEQQAAARAEAALEERIGGMAELYRTQELARQPLAASVPGTIISSCSLDTETRAC